MALVQINLNEIQTYTHTQIKNFALIQFEANVANEFNGPMSRADIFFLIIKIYFADINKLFI